MPDLTDLEQSIGYHFDNQALLLRALTHPSYSGRDRSVADNSILSLLGKDALRFVLIEELVSNHTGNAGVFTQVRDAVLGQSNLFKLAQTLGLEQFVRVMPQVFVNSEKAKTEFLGRVVEALAGAIVGEAGYAALKIFAEKFFFHNLRETLRSGGKDAKTLLQEKVWRVHGVMPTYRLLDEMGPGHQKQYTVGVYVGEVLIAKATNSPKKEAEMSAASLALEDFNA